MGIGQEIEYLALVYIYGMKKETFEDAPSVPQIAVTLFQTLVAATVLLNHHSNATARIVTLLPKLLPLGFC